jgi:hypothetical protein
MPKGVYQRSQSQMSVPPMPDPPGIPIPSSVVDPNDVSDIPGLVVPTRLAPSIDLTRPEDCPDLADGEWSKRHLVQFLARQPRSMVFIPKEGWEAKNEESFQTVGYQGHWFTVVKNKPVSVPIQIAAIIEQSQLEFPTTQSQFRKRQITDIRDLDAGPGGVQGPEVFV